METIQVNQHFRNPLTDLCKLNNNEFYGSTKGQFVKFFLVKSPESVF